MAKSQTNAATGASQSMIDQANATMPGVTAGLQGEASGAGANAAQSFNAAQSGYNTQQTTGGYNPQTLANLNTMYSSMQPTGGYDPTQLSNIQGNLANMNATGGMNQKQLNQLQSGYGQMAQTGGYTPGQIQNQINQATAGTTATAGNLAAAAQRSAAATGGNAGAALTAMGSNLGAQQANATNTALANITNQVNQNKLAGLGGLGTTEQNLAAARQGVTGQEAALAGGVAQGRQNLAGQQQGLASGVAQGVQNANAGQANLYSTSAGQQAALNAQALQGLGLQFGTEAQGAQILTELSKNPGLFQTGFQDFTSVLSS